MTNANVAELVDGITRIQSKMVALGAEQERKRLEPHIGAILEAYRRACLMPEAKIPTILSAAIVSAEIAFGK